MFDSTIKRPRHHLQRTAIELTQEFRVFVITQPDKEITGRTITVSSLDEQLIEKAIRAVEENMDNSEFSVEELSSYVGMSRGHLYKKLIMITGKSPLEFIRILRVKRGKQLLEQSQLNVSQIAYQIGLSPKQFAKYFKEEFGYVPSEYIKNNNTN